MKKITGFVFAALFGAGLQAQVTMTPLVPAAGIIQKNQLWNLLIVSTGSAAAACQVSMVLSTTGDNQPVMTGLGNIFYAGNGTSQFGSSDMELIHYEYPSPYISNQDPNGYLPAGEYQACYTLSVGYGDGTPQPVQEQCVTITIEPLSPPMLNMPADEEEVYTTAPQFTWLPPTPLMIFDNLTYDLIVVELSEGQSVNDAMQQNTPVYKVSNLADIFSNYPPSYAPLDSGKQYAWQVIAKNNGQYAAQSEIWRFTIHPDSSYMAEIFNDKPYVKMKQTIDAYLSVFGSAIRCCYNNEADDSTVTYQITSLADEDFGSVVKTGEISLLFGINFIDLPLTRDNRLIDGKTYLMQFGNSRNEQWSIKFIYKKDKE